MPAWEVGEGFGIVLFRSPASSTGSRRVSHQRVGIHCGPVLSPAFQTFRSTEAHNYGAGLDGYGTCRSQPHLPLTPHPGEVMRAAAPVRATRCDYFNHTPSLRPKLLGLPPLPPAGLNRMVTSSIQLTPVSKSLQNPAHDRSWIGTVV